MAKQKPKVKVLDADGNVFDIHWLTLLDTIRKAVKSKLDKDEMSHRAWQSQSYEEKLSIMQEYVEFV